MKKTVPFLLSAVVLAGLASLPVVAQVPGPGQPQPQNPQNTLQQVNGPLSNAPTSGTSAELPAENSDLSGVEVVNKYPVPQTLTFSTDQNAFWTSNAFLTNHNDVSSFGYNGRLQAIYIPYSTRDWTPSISFEQQFIRYDHTSVLDFDGQTAEIASRYDILKDKTLSWTATYSLQRLYTDRESLGEFYKESFFDNGISYVKAITKANNLFFVGSYDIGWRLTDPQLYSRVDNSVLLSLLYLPVAELRIQPFVRPAVYAYTDNRELNRSTGELFETGRTDYNISAGCNFTYNPIQQVALTATLNWTGNYSNEGDRCYRAVTPGIGVSGAIGFW